MTSNQLTYWANIERERSNKAAEALRNKELRQRAAELAWDKAKTQKEIELRKWTAYFNKYGLLGEPASQIGSKITSGVANTVSSLDNTISAFKESGIAGGLNSMPIWGTIDKAVDRFATALGTPAKRFAEMLKESNFTVTSLPR